MLSLLQILALSTLSLSLCVSGAPESEPALVKRAEVKGVDVPDGFSWAAIGQGRIPFAYILATQGTTSIEPSFYDTYLDATARQIICGAYHYALPDVSDGATQANFFLLHGGGWSSDGSTLPGAVDLEGDCAGLSPSEMVTWIGDFSNTYQAATSRYPVIYTTTSWWTTCTGNSAAFASTNSLWWASRANSKAFGKPPGSWR